MSSKVRAVFDRLEIPYDATPGVVNKAQYRLTAKIARGPSRGKREALKRLREDAGVAIAYSRRTLASQRRSTRGDSASDGGLHNVPSAHRPMFELTPLITPLYP